MASFLAPEGKTNEWVWILFPCPPFSFPPGCQAARHRGCVVSGGRVRKLGVATWRVVFLCWTQPPMYCIYTTDIYSLVVRVNRGVCIATHRRPHRLPGPQCGTFIHASVYTSRRKSKPRVGVAEGTVCEYVGGIDHGAPFPLPPAPYPCSYPLPPCFSPQPLTPGLALGIPKSTGLAGRAGQG